MEATQADIAHLEKLYKGCKAYHGDMHDHSDSGGKSDGKVPLAEWKDIMAEKAMDFATIVDHKQSSHMRRPEWDPAVHIGGTEAGTHIIGRNLEQDGMHYNMIFTDPDQQDALVTKFVEYKFSGGDKGIFTYPRFEPDRFRDVVRTVWEKGGFFVHVHPKYKNYLKSDDPLDYWYGDYTGLEIMTGSGGNMTSQENMDAYELWVQLLDLGKTVYATTGADSHRRCHTHSLATVYSERRHAEAFLAHFRRGHHTAGPVGIRMCVGDTVTGGRTAFDGKRLVIAVGDFHRIAYKPDHQYRLDVYNEKGLVCSQALTGETGYFALETEPCRYYRANVYDMTGGYIFAVGNPIWNCNY